METVSSVYVREARGKALLSMCVSICIVTAS